MKRERGRSHGGNHHTYTISKSVTFPQSWGRARREGGSKRKEKLRQQKEKGGHKPPKEISQKKKRM